MTTLLYLAALINNLSSKSNRIYFYCEGGSSLILLLFHKKKSWLKNNWKTLHFMKPTANKIVTTDPLAKKSKPMPCLMLALARCSETPSFYVESNTSFADTKCPKHPLQSKSFIWVTLKYLGSCWSYRKTKATLLCPSFIPLLLNHISGL